MCPVSVAEPPSPQVPCWHWRLTQLLPPELLPEPPPELLPELPPELLPEPPPELLPEPPPELPPDELPPELPPAVGHYISERGLYQPSPGRVEARSL